MRSIQTGIACLLALCVVACTALPTSPSIAVMPGYGKSFEQFNIDDAVCRQYASNQIGGTVQQGNEQAVGSAVVGTVVGAIAGGAINGQQGAAVGAGSGLLVGSAVGANSSQYAGYSAQRRYDISYQQCMYSKGNNIPGWGVQPVPPPPPGLPAPLPPQNR